jgi:hypothetical protein
MKRSICKPFFLLIFLNVLSPVYLLAQSASQTLELNERIRKVEQSLTGGIVVEGDSSWTIKQRMELYHVPAVTIAVIKDYKIDWAKALPTPRHVFRQLR